MIIRTSLSTLSATVLTFAVATAIPVKAQVFITPETTSSSAPTQVAENTVVALPEAPQPVASAAVLPQPNGYQSVSNAPIAPLHMKYIPAGETAQRITAHDKVVIGLEDLVSPENFVAMLASSGFEQLSNGAPNYGTDRGAYGERLGAAAIRETSQGLFTDVVFAPLLHEDPRYYVLGPGHSFLHRTVYAVTRPLITKTDGGRSTVNAALLMGYAGSAALSYAYYPPINQNTRDTAATFGGSIGGAALGFFFSEFSDDLRHAIHLKKK